MSHESNLSRVKELKRRQEIVKWKEVYGALDVIIKRDTIDSLYSASICDDFFDCGVCNFLFKSNQSQTVHLPPVFVRTIMSSHDVDVPLIDIVRVLWHLCYEQIDALNGWAKP